ncbi:hypothetical protein CLOM_g5994, partial [Closterium sp. NIES-68]
LEKGESAPPAHASVPPAQSAGGARRWPPHPAVEHSGRFPAARYQRPWPPVWVIVMKWLPWVAVALAVWLFAVGNAPVAVDLHPHEHHLLTAYSPLVAGIQVSPLAPMPAPPPMLVTFAHYPPIVNEHWDTGRRNVRVEPYSYRSWLIYLNKWSQVVMACSTIHAPPGLTLQLLVIEGRSRMEEYKHNPMAFTGALRKYIMTGDDSWTFQVPRDGDYYFVLSNYYTYPATVDVHFAVTSVLFDISKGKKACKIKGKPAATRGYGATTYGPWNGAWSGAGNGTETGSLAAALGVVDGPSGVNGAYGMGGRRLMDGGNGGGGLVNVSAVAVLRSTAAAGHDTAHLATGDGGSEAYNEKNDNNSDDDDDDDEDSDGDVCGAKTPLWKIRYIVLAAPKTSNPTSTWHLQVGYQPRWLTYLALIVIPWLLSLIALSIYRCQLYLQHRSDSMRVPPSLSSISTDPLTLPSSSPSEHHPLLSSAESHQLYTPPDPATAAAAAAAAPAAPIPDTWGVTSDSDRLAGSSAPSAPPLESPSGKAAPGMGNAEQRSEEAGGSSASAASGGGRGGEGEDMNCCVCMENPRNAVILDCGHRATCYSCGQELMRMANKRCPICRREVRDITRIYDP